MSTACVSKTSRPISVRSGTPSESKRLDASYIPSPVREVRWPKPGGGTRMLGIPTVLDRFMTQAIVQVLSPVFDPGFSDHSYGFRPGRSARHAVGPARDYISRGHRWVVDLD